MEPYNRPLDNQQQRSNSSFSQTQLDNKNIIPYQIQSFIKLISNIMHQYTNLPPWKDIPSIEDLATQNGIAQITKKLDITLTILLKHANRESHKEIEHILQFTINLFKLDPNLLTKVIKLNLLINNGINLTQLISNENSKDNKEKIMLNYLQGIIKNFYLAYGNSDKRKLEMIGNKLALLVHNDEYFDYEYFFLYEDEYIIKQYIPKLKEQTKRIVITFTEDLITEFELGIIDYASLHSIDYYLAFLEEAQLFKEYKAKHSAEEYKQFKAEIKKKLGSHIMK